MKWNQTQTLEMIFFHFPWCAIPTIIPYTILCAFVSVAAAASFLAHNTAIRIEFYGSTSFANVGEVALFIFQHSVAIIVDRRRNALRLSRQREDEKKVGCAAAAGKVNGEHYF